MDAIHFLSAWASGVHETPDQRKRIENAKSSKTTPLEVNKDAKTGVFPSSNGKPYETSLHACTCSDFSRRKLPCKHIYRLAMECGELDVPFSTGENKNVLANRQLSVSEAVAELENLSDSQQKIVSGMLLEILYRGAKTVEIAQKDDTNALLSSKLIQTHGRVNAGELLQRMPKRDIVALLEAHGVAYDKKLKKSDLVVWCESEATAIFAGLPVINLCSFSECFNRARRGVYTYLLRKFGWDSYCDPEMREIYYPHGAKFGDACISFEAAKGNGVTATISGCPDICFFPDDEITRLLTLYGHNRCLGGYRPKLKAEIWPEEQGNAEE